MTESRAQPMRFASTGPQGHRGRMRARLLAAGPAGLADYELLEMLLFLSIPRRDTKPLAKAIINRFGDLYRALGARAAELRAAGLDHASIGIVDLVREAASRLAVAEAVSRPLLNNTEPVIAYLDLPARLRRPAHLAALFLNNRNQLLADLPFPEAQAPTDIARAIARHAVQVHATALILATIRPGTEPPAVTARDRDLTGRITRAGHSLGVAVHDHLVFAGGGRLSLRREGLLK
jgi:DNA repair protein RadC